METAPACDDGMAVFDKERCHNKRLQEQRDGPRIRGRIRLTGPGTEAGMRHRSAMVVGGRFRIGMIEDAGDRKDGEYQIEASERGRQANGGFRETHHGIRL